MINCLFVHHFIGKAPAQYS